MHGFSPLRRVSRLLQLILGALENARTASEPASLGSTDSVYDGGEDPSKPSDICFNLLLLL